MDCEALFLQSFEGIKDFMKLLKREAGCRAVRRGNVKTVTVMGET